MTVERFPEEQRDFAEAGGCGWDDCPYRYDWTWHHDMAEAVSGQPWELDYERQHPERDPD